MIGSDVGGIKELVTDNKTGKIYEAGNTKNMADVIISMAKDLALCENLGQMAMKDVKENRNWSNICSKTLAIYDKLAGSVH